MWVSVNGILAKLSKKNKKNCKYEFHIIDFFCEHGNASLH